MDRTSRGFTLIEVLVAIALLAMLATMSWRAIEGMSDAESMVRERSDSLLRIRSGLDQWQADLDAVENTEELTPMVFDGKVMRLTRRDATEFGVSSPGIRVVAWTLRDSTDPQTPGQWVRWQSTPVTQRQALARAWQRASEWGNGMNDEVRTAMEVNGDTQIALFPLSQWQIFYHRGDGWSNPLSSTGTGNSGGASNGTSGDAEDTMPQGVRVILDVVPGASLSGRITRDWVRPTLEPSQ